MRFLAFIRRIIRTAWFNRTLAAGAILLWTAFAAGLMHSAWSAFTSFKFSLFDYGIYTNTVWNCGHGRLFTVLHNTSYLKTHLSFSLALLGPFFRAWDHPFLMSVIQWCFITGGAAILVIAVIKQKTPAAPALALAVFYSGYFFTQTVHLCEFHGVSAYMFVFPWLYYCLALRKNFAWMPLAILLGIREDAFIFAMPVLLYFAVKEKNRMVWAMFCATLLYGILAVFVIYPAINDKSLFARREEMLPDNIFKSLIGSREQLTDKLKAFAWTILPAIPFLRRGRIVIPAFVAVPLFVSFDSAFEPQYSLKLHYSALIMACLGIALAETFVKGKYPRKARKKPAGPIGAVALILITCAMHLDRGYLRKGGKHKACYAQPNPAGIAVLKAARRLPREGILLAKRSLMPFCANRADIRKWKYFTRNHDMFDVVFASTEDLENEQGFRNLLNTGEFKVLTLGPDHVCLVRK